MSPKDWVKLPTRWIADDGLAQLKWRDHGGNATAALMILVCLAHYADQQTGLTKATYSELAEATGLSRTMISRALTLLVALRILIRDDERRSWYALADFTVNGWGKLPAKSMCTGRAIVAFHHFHLRSMVELNALKMLLLVVQRRDSKTNMAHVTYAQISKGTGIEEGRIKAAISLLTVHGLVFVERVKSTMSEHGIANAYRLPGIDSRRHMGTTGRATEIDLDEFAA